MNRHRLPMLLALGVVVIITGTTWLVNGLWQSGGTDADSSRADVAGLTVQPLAATAVPLDLPSGAPAPPTSQPTAYCGSNTAKRLAVDKARQARLLAQTFYIPKSHDATTATTAADFAALCVSGEGFPTPLVVPL